MLSVFNSIVKMQEW